MCVHAQRENMHVCDVLYSWIFFWRQKSTTGQIHYRLIWICGNMLHICCKWISARIQMQDQNIFLTMDDINHNRRKKICNSFLLQTLLIK